MTITQNLLTPNPYSRPQIKMQKIQGAVLHWVANPNTSALANRNYFENLKAQIPKKHTDGKFYQSNANGTWKLDADEKKIPMRYASAHYIIGLNGEIIQCIPENEVAYHAGDGAHNQKYIGIECCHPDDTGRFNDKTYKSLVELTADILKRHGVREIKRHYDVTGKYCPLWFVRNATAYNNFKNEVYYKMDNKEVSTVDEALTVLAKKDILNGTEYWLNAVKCVKFLDGLLIKFANYANKG